MPTVSRRPRLSLDDLHHLRWLLGGGLMLLSVVTVFYMDIGSEWAAAIATAGIAAAWIRPTLPARVPAWIHRFAFPVIVALFLGDLWITAQLLPAIVRLDLLLLLYRGFSYRKRRDDLQIIILGLFLIVVAGVLTVSLEFAAQIFVFTALALALLTAITLTDATEGYQAGVATADWAPHARTRRLLRRLREVADWRLIALGSALFVGVMVVSGLLFVAIPRFQLENSLFLERFITRKAKSGFNDSIKFGDVTEIEQDDSVAMNVDLSDPTQAPANPYWRMLVLDEYRNGGFRLSPLMRAASFNRERADIGIRGFGRQPPAAPTWTFYVESGVSRYLPLLGRFERLRFREAQYFRDSPSLGLVALRDEPAAMTAYRVEGMPAGSGELPDHAFAIRWKNRSLPGVVPLLTRIELSEPDRQALVRLNADAGATGAAGASEYARRVCVWLVHRHRFTLDPVIPAGSGDPLVRWAESDHPGHCELFAGTFVLMARSAGFPARVVTGFRGGTWNGYSNNFTVRNSDAHAWAEIWDETKSAWLRADPLAPNAAAAGETAGEVGLARRLDRSWSARFDSLRVFWYRRIVNFDQGTQIDTLKAAKSVAENSGKAIRAGFERVISAVRRWFGGPWNARRIAGAGAAVAAAGGAVQALRSYGRWRLLHGGRTRNKSDPVRREAGRWLTRVGRSSPVAADLQRLRYGPRESWPDPRSVFRRAKREPRASSRNIS